jgi:hypothetical protein
MDFIDHICFGRGIQSIFHLSRCQRRSNLDGLISVMAGSRFLFGVREVYDIVYFMYDPFLPHALIMPSSCPFSTKRSGGKDDI